MPAEMTYKLRENSAFNPTKIFTRLASHSQLLLAKDLAIGNGSGAT